ncbi:SDR family NAD(P)-dependent oxidoreductase [Roseibium sediminis]|uniref:SDR family NAD(P)-dependent oxidoreductase n=1 Tax=Roseibium sediminis TaxID=1775174 RepID=UPI00123CD2DB|nr:SDR family NAD(P)-dependent oxidoreductase [Roseibium sediminis]
MSQFPDKKNAFVATPEHGCAWITGASSGIGHELALTLARSGWTVAVTARSEAALKAMETAVGEADGSSSGRIEAFPGDVSNAEAMKATASAIESKCGPIALLVANAGIYISQDGLDSSPDDWKRTFDVNLGGTVNVLLPVIASMKAKGRGQIGVVASVAGYRGLPTSPAYGATKAGLINMAESLKFDLDRAGIRIQVINPGFVDTPATKTNPFSMPYLMTPQEAATAIIKGLTDPKAFEIAFPKPFVRQLKLLRLLPYRWYFKLVAKNTGWDKKT